MYCNECGTQIPDGAKFCANCGAAAAAPQRYCQSCGSQVSSTATICPSCGSTINAKAASAQTNQQPVYQAAPAPQYQQPQIVINNNSSNVNTNTNRNTVSHSAGRPGKNKWAAFFLCLFLGYFGAHKFYEGKILLGVVYLFTFGLFGIGWIIDCIALFFKPNPYYP